jgi:hypothetical protein
VAAPAAAQLRRAAGWQGSGGGGSTRTTADHFNLIIISGCYRLNETELHLGGVFFLFLRYLKTRPGRGRSVQHWRERKKKSHMFVFGLTVGGCRNSFLVFVSDRSRSGLAKKSVQILDSLDVLP